LDGVADADAELVLVGVGETDDKGDDGLGAGVADADTDGPTDFDGDGDRITLGSGDIDMRGIGRISKGRPLRMPEIMLCSKRMKSARLNFPWNLITNVIIHEPVETAEPPQAFGNVGSNVTLFSFSKIPGIALHIAPTSL
jgi:hypothetical protein